MKCLLRAFFIIYRLHFVTISRIAIGYSGAITLYLL